jgi:hypothetical protein
VTWDQAKKLSSCLCLVRTGRDRDGADNYDPRRQLIDAAAGEEGRKGKTPKDFLEHDANLG